jgi:integrase
MNQSAPCSPSPHTSWPWPVNLLAYDRHPLLSEAERTELDRKMKISHYLIRGKTRGILHRLFRPIDDVLACVHASARVGHATRRVMASEMHRRGTAFWAWSCEEWLESIGATPAAFASRYASHPQQPCDYRARGHLPVLAYLLCSVEPISTLIETVDVFPLAQKIFGREKIDEAVQRLAAVLNSWGYHQQQRQHFIGCVCYVLLRNRSPHLEDLSSELLESVNQTCQVGCVQRKLPQVARALFALGCITRPLTELRRRGPLPVAGTDGSVSEEWLAWCQRWRTHATQQHPQRFYYLLLKVGRWLNEVHPEVNGPADFTYELAAEFVAAVNEMKIGEWTDTHQRRIAADRTGLPLRPSVKSALLQAMRVFLYDCQAWQWIPARLNADRALRTPRSLRNQIGPNPRVIDRNLWAKLLWAALNLEAEDLPKYTGEFSPYPLELVRALAVVWCFSALRSDEILRLRMGCVRWQREDVTIPETGEILPQDAVCFLDVPLNKTMPAYTKAVHPLVGKRIHEWEQVRPREQLPMVDSKTGEVVQFLFSYRGTRVRTGYINDSVIPMLCRKADIPERDSRGKITSHRARATIASMLYNAKNPLSIFELKEYLGHKYVSSTRYYAQVDPTKLASRVVQTGYLEQNLATIEVLLNQDAVLSGAAARGEVWKYYDLGHGYCTNTFWAECKHRMACARCPFYRPKSATLDQLLEGKANLVRMLEYVKLTEDEHLLVTEGIQLHQTLIERLADLPTPVGPTPRELENTRQGEAKVIPLKTIRRTKEKKPDEP